MKINKNILSVGILTLCIPVFGQVPLEPSVVTGVKVSQVTFKGIGDTLLVDMDLSVAGIKLPQMEHAIITPMLMDDQGNSFEMKSFSLDGKMRARAAYRDAILRKQKHKPILPVNYSYRERFFILPWMEHAKLVLRGTTECCGGNASSYFRTLADSVTFVLPPAPYQMHPQVSFVLPDPEPIKNRAESGNARLEFQSGKSEILPAFRKNQNELDKIGKAISDVLNDTTATIQSIVLKAYSSPEGTYANNAKLSAARALALKSYVEKNYNLKGILVKAESVAEDWEGLEVLLRESDIPQKQLFLDIIARNTDLDRREKLFKGVAKGVPFRNLITNVFPLLRRTDYQLHYSVKEFTVEQGREVFKTHPGQLSLNEMFHVANSYGIGSNEFNEVFDVAVRIFPKDPVANINAAAVAILRSDTVTARKFLSRVEGDTRAQNNIAVLHLMAGELEQAKTRLNRSLQTGVESKEVRHNISEVERKEKDNILFDKYRRK